MVIFLVALCCIGRANAQQPTPLEIAKSIDLESRNLKDAPEATRAAGVKKLALRIRQLPPQYAVSLATNLAIDHSDVDDRNTVQFIADTLVQALRSAPERSKDTSPYRTLAELSRYSQIQVSLDDPQYSAALKKLDGEEEQRRKANFTLTDLEGKQWTLRSLQGKVVLVNFWATWCGPCRKEIPALQEIYQRFQTKGLVILALSDEDKNTISHFAKEQSISFPLLLDTGQQLKRAFFVDGIPASFLYNRSGQLVAQMMIPLSTQGLLDILAKAGLH